MSSTEPFLTRRPGEEQARVENPDGWTPTEGTAALVFGADHENWTRRFNVGDYLDFTQNAGFTPGKVLRFNSRIRGPSRMPALSGAEPFALADGQTLQIKIDGGSTQTLTFSTGQFAAIGAATSAEVVAAINAAILGALAEVTGSDEFTILSDAEGRGSRVEIVGGTAAAALGIAETAWAAKVLIDGSEVLSLILWPGETRDLSDLGVNLSAHGDPADVSFRLELVTL